MNLWYKKHEVALAYSEQLHSRNTVFHKDVLETDAARFGSRKEDNARVHQGRLMVCKARLKKSWSSTALPPSRSTGQRGMPPETSAEVKLVLARATGKGIVLAPDGGAAWRNTAKTTPTLNRQRSCRRRTLTPTSLPCYVKGARGRRGLPTRRRGTSQSPQGITAQRVLSLEQ